MKYQNSSELLPILKEEVDNVLESIYYTNNERYITTSKFRLQLAYYAFERLQHKLDRDCLPLIFCSNKIPSKSLEFRLFLEQFIFESIEDFCKFQTESIANKNISDYNSNLSVLSRKEVN